MIDPGRTATWVTACFLSSTVAALGLGVVWWRQGPHWLAGLLLASALAALAAGLAGWANRLTPQGPFSEERPRPAETAERQAAADDISEGSRVARRGLVIASLTGAVATLGGALTIPFSSLGPRPGNALLRTSWSRGRRAVNTDGRAVVAADLPLGGIVTVFPEGHAGSADGQVVLIRLDPSRLELPEGREGWVTDGLIAYSKVCTHAGCPVGLYSSESNELLCPCHQSSFDVLRGAVPTSGPAAWPLPQLPLAVDGEGIVVANGPLSEPVGPGWWRSE